MVVPIELLRQSEMYQAIREEGREEGRYELDQIPDAATLRQRSVAISNT